MHFKKSRCLFLIFSFLLVIFMLFGIKRKEPNLKAKTIIKKEKENRSRLLIIDVTKCDARLLNVSHFCRNNSSLRQNSTIVNKDCSRCHNSIVSYHTIWEIKSENNDFQFRVLNLNLMSYLTTQVNKSNDYFIDIIYYTSTLFF